jgi:hypothetical protein
MLENLKVFFQPKQRSSMTLITVNGAIDHNNLPNGFFNVTTVSGKSTLGFRGLTGTSFDCGTTVVDGAERHSLAILRDQLPTVKLDYGRQQSDRLLDTSELDEFDGEFKYDPLR